MLGGDLRCPYVLCQRIRSLIPSIVHLERLRTLPEATVRFYVAELASALAYLHEKRIVHRDIKPDNILLDSQGHAHITDFNVAVYHPVERNLTSIAGSKAYMGKFGFYSRRLRSLHDASPRGVIAQGIHIFGRLVVSRHHCI